MCRTFQHVSCYGPTDCPQVLVPEVPDFVFGSTSGRPALRLTEPTGRSVRSNPRARCFGSELNMVLAFRSSTSPSVTQLPVSTEGWLGLTDSQGQMQGGKSGRCGLPPRYLFRCGSGRRRCALSWRASDPLNDRHTATASYTLRGARVSRRTHTPQQPIHKHTSHCSSLTISDQVWHPHQATGQLSAFVILQDSHICSCNFEFSPTILVNISCSVSPSLPQEKLTKVKISEA